MLKIPLFSDPRVTSIVTHHKYLQVEKVFTNLFLFPMVTRSVVTRNTVTILMLLLYPFVGATQPEVGGVTERREDVKRYP